MPTHTETSTTPDQAISALSALTPVDTVRITPTQGKILLSENCFEGQGERHQKGAHLAAIKAEMLAGRWNPKASIITIAVVDGKPIVINGHSRLQAAVSLDRDLETRVDVQRCNAAEAADLFEIYDRFGKRSDVFLLQATGETIPRLSGVSSSTAALNGIYAYAELIGKPVGTLDDSRDAIARARPLINTINRVTDEYVDHAASLSIRRFLFSRAAVAAVFMVVADLNGFSDFASAFWSTGGAAQEARLRLDRELAKQPHERKTSRVYARWMARAWNHRDRDTLARFHVNQPVRVDGTEYKV